VFEGVIGLALGIIIVLLQQHFSWLWLHLRWFIQLFWSLENVLIVMGTIVSLGLLPHWLREQPSEQETVSSEVQLQVHLPCPKKTPNQGHTTTDEPRFSAPEPKRLASRRPCTLPVTVP
jgi:hypothetical protein